MKTADGIEILFHIGIDTVNMEGKGFEVLVQEQEQVAKGDLLVRFDIDKIKDAGFDPTTMIIITNPKNVKIELTNTQDIITNDCLMKVGGVAL